MLVRVYFNLGKKLYSIQHKGKVIALADELALNSVRFTISETVRQRVLKTRRMEVHAYAVGELRWAKLGRHQIEDALLESCERVDRAGCTVLGNLIAYNPYKAGTFVLKGTDTPITEARLLYATTLAGYPEMWAIPIDRQEAVAC